MVIIHLEFSGIENQYGSAKSAVCVTMVGALSRGTTTKRSRVVTDRHPACQQMVKDAQLFEGDSSA